MKEGLLLKQTSSFQRWKKRYFKLRGRTLYYAKDAKVRLLAAFIVQVQHLDVTPDLSSTFPLVSVVWHGNENKPKIFHFAVIFISN